MYRIAILGTENSHALNFIQLIKGLNPKNPGEKKEDFEIVGIYGYDDAANRAIIEKCGDIYVADNPHEFLGKVDSVMVTARHGDNHLKYAEPYIKAGLPVWIDKPITVSESDARLMVKLASDSGSLLCGGSMASKVPDTLFMASRFLSEDLGANVGGSVAAPVNMKNPYGDFFFYSQHLVEIMLTVFGTGIESVYAVPRENSAIAICRYPNFDVSAHFGGWSYSVSVYKENGVYQKELDLFSRGTQLEFLEYENMLKTGKMPTTYEKFITPVFMLNALNSSMEKGISVDVHKF